MHIVIADDHPLLRHGILDVMRRAVPAARFDDANNAAELFSCLRTVPAGLFILDLSLPDHYGLECLTELGKRHPGLPVLVSRMHAEEVFALRALEQGALGYLTKDRAVDEIATAL